MTHPLANYFARNPDVKRKQFIARAGISRMALWRLMHGEGDFSTALLKRVSLATDGAVTVEALARALERGEVVQRRKQGETTAA